MSEETVAYVHQIILDDAAEQANHKLESLGLGSGKLLRPDPVRSRRGGLALAVEQSLYESVTEEQIKQIRSIAKDAIRESIVKHQKEFVSSIVSDARQGQNYFDRFKTDEEE